MLDRLWNYVAVVVSLLVVWTFIQGPGQLQAQTSFGVIVGTVTDPSQAAVPDVSLTVTNTQTGIARQVNTNAAGEYRVESLLPSVYSVKAEHAGFQVTEVTGVVLPVARTVTVNIVMQVGAIAQRVQVTAQAPQLDTATSTVGSVVNNASVVTLPLNGRSYTDLIMMVPGTVAGTSFYAITGGHNYYVSGMNSAQNSYTVDGMTANETFLKQVGIQPSVDAIQEFKIQTHISAAEYGAGAGANVNVALKSGTNALHGSLFEFLRNDKLDAVDWFTNAQSPAGQAVRPGYKRNQWGLVFGGPVYIPKVYDGRDKFFWMFNYEGQKIRQPSWITAIVPTRAQFGGDLRDAPPIYDPATTQQVGVDEYGNPIYTREQISCDGVDNVICPDRISPAMAAYANMFYPATDTNLVTNNNPLRLDAYQINTRADYKINDKLNFFARYSHSDASQTSPRTLPTLANITAQKFRNAVVNWTYLPSPTAVLNFKGGVNRSNVFQVDTVPAPGADAYYAQNPLQGLMAGNAEYPMLFAVGITNFSGTSQQGTPLPVTDIQGALGFTKIWGKHTFKTGATIDRFRSMSGNYGLNSLSFGALPTSDPQNSGATGYGLASFLLGLPTGGSRYLGGALRHYTWGQYQFYLQDDIRLTRRLTVNLGLRYEWDQLPREDDNLVSQFDTTTGLYIWAGNNPVTGEGPNARRTIRDPDFNNFAPRIGFAYTPTSNTTIRGGYGIFYSTNFIWEMQGAGGQWPYALAERYSGTNTYLPNMPVEAYWPAYTEVTPDATPASQHVNNRLDRTSYNQQWNLGVQRQLANELMLQVDYVATRGVKMPLFFTPNVAPPGPGDVNLRRRWPDAGAFQEGTNRASTNYHALQARLEKRFSNGLQFLGSYAWAHYIDIAGSGFLDNWGGPQDLRNWAADRGSGNIDYRHILTMSYIYQLPFGRGKRFLSNSNSIVNQLLGGWELSGITRYTSGAPFTVFIDRDNANVGAGGGQRPDLVSGTPLFISTTDKTLSGLNPAAFSMPAQYTFGNLGRNTLRAPGFGNWDLGLFKNFSIHGEKKLQFRAEFFNAFNNVSMAGPEATWCQAAPGDPAPGQPGSCNPYFGQVFSTQSLAREIQFALKFIF